MQAKLHKLNAYTQLQFTNDTFIFKKWQRRFALFYKMRKRKILEVILIKRKNRIETGNFLPVVCFAYRINKTHTNEIVVRNKMSCLIGIIPTNGVLNKGLGWLNSYLVVRLSFALFFIMAIEIFAFLCFGSNEEK